MAPVALLFTCRMVLVAQFRERASGGTVAGPGVAPVVYCLSLGSESGSPFFFFSNWHLCVAPRQRGRRPRNGALFCLEDKNNTALAHTVSAHLSNRIVLGDENQKGSTPIASAKWAPGVRLSAKLLIPQVGWRPLNSDGSARRDSLSL
jgi:hypothetical protein